MPVLEYSFSLQLDIDKLRKRIEALKNTAMTNEELALDLLEEIVSIYMNYNDNELVNM